MAKVIRIEICSDCRFFFDGNWKMSCRKVGNKRLENVVIPEWCPLEDAK